jgi:hypothetical protein
MTSCTNCGYEIERDARFCQRCGTATATITTTETDEAPTWHLPQTTGKIPDEARPTEQMNQGQTASPGLPTGPAYLRPEDPHEQPTTAFQPPPSYQPPSEYPQTPLFQRQSEPQSQPPPPVYPPGYYQPHPGYLQPAPVSAIPPNRTISLGDWLSKGWRVYAENWFLMSLATLLVGVIGVGTLGILAGPMIMGLYRMAFKTIRGERPVMGDLFNWDGRFLQAFLAFLIHAAIYGGLQGASGRSGALSAILNFAVLPILTLIFGLAMPMILDRRDDIAASINEVGKTIFTKDAFMWWIVGFVFATIASGGFFACGIGGLVTVPWIISAFAVAYSNQFGLDDPNRTLH